MFGRLLSEASRVTWKNARLSHEISTFKVNNIHPIALLDRTVHSRISKSSLTRSSATMASLVNEQHEWNAVRVRQTFLDYFKENGHTFGRIQMHVHEKEKIV